MAGYHRRTEAKLSCALWSKKEVTLKQGVEFGGHWHRGKALEKAMQRRLIFWSRWIMKVGRSNAPMSAAEEKLVSFAGPRAKLIVPSRRKSSIFWATVYNKWSKQFDIRPHRRRTWTVQSYSSGGANVHPIYRKPWLPWQHPLEPRNRLCLHRIAWPGKPTPRIKQLVAT